MLLAQALRHFRRHVVLVVFREHLLSDEHAVRAELAARNRTDAQADAIVAAAHALADSRDESVRTAADTAFHQTIALASGNQLFYQIVRSFEQMMLIAIPQAWAGRSSPQEREESLALHHQVASAIASRDAVSARLAMQSHFARSIGDLFQR